MEFKALAKDKTGRLKWWHNVYTDGDDVLIDTGYGIKRLEDVKAICASTGLKDKEGKEIYEGDVVMLAGKHTTKIEFIDGTFYAVGYGPLSDWISDGWNNVEVVGDIYTA